VLSADGYSPDCGNGGGMSMYTPYYPSKTKPKLVGASFTKKNSTIAFSCRGGKIPAITLKGLKKSCPNTEGQT
jgi:hypothetical protein